MRGAVVELTANTDHVKGAHGAGCVVHVRNVRVDSQLNRVWSIGNVHRKARSRVGPLRGVYYIDVVHANQLALGGFIHIGNDHRARKGAVGANNHDRVGIDLRQTVEVPDYPNNANDVAFVNRVSKVFGARSKKAESDAAVVNGKGNVAGGGKGLGVDAKYRTLEFAHNPVGVRQKLGIDSLNLRQRVGWNKHVVVSNGEGEGVWRTNT